ncbi:MAG: glycosyltransferase family 2 protein, partial [Bdellovibrio sp.]|nr:glycosyltransferase family 2 protein [Bdellovibrio sp.]
MKISTVIPSYGAPNSLKELHSRLIATFAQLNCQYEIIFVNDACPKNSWTKIQEICALDPHTKGLNLARNFGQHAAISAGLSQCTGDWITVMDCDLQDDPKYIPQFLQKAGSTYDVVLARRTHREEKFFKKLQSWLFYKFLSAFLDVKMDHQVGNYGLY